MPRQTHAFIIILLNPMLKPPIIPLILSFQQCHNLEAIAPVCYPGFALIAPSITNISKIFRSEIQFIIDDDVKLCSIGPPNRVSPPNRVLLLSSLLKFGVFSNVDCVCVCVCVCAYI